MQEERKGQPSAVEPLGQTAKEEPSKPSEQLIDLGDGQKVTPEKLTKMWADTQVEIQKLQMSKTKEPQTEEQVAAKEQLELVADALLPILQSRGLATKEEVSALKGNTELDKLLNTNPALASRKQAIVDLAKANPGMAYADIVEKYGLGTLRAPTDTSRDVIGSGNRKVATGDEKISIEDVHTSEDMVRYEKEHNVGRKGGRLSAQRALT